MRSFFKENSNFFPEGTFEEVELPDHFPKQCTTEEAVREVVVTQSDILHSREGEKDLLKQRARDAKLQKRFTRVSQENEMRWSYDALFQGLDDMPVIKRAKVIRMANKMAPSGCYFDMSSDELKAANAAAKEIWESLSRNHE